MAKMGAFDWLIFVLVIIGALNWGLIGFFGFNLVEAIFGTSILTTIIYDIVGLAAVYGAYKVFTKK